MNTFFMTFNTEQLQNLLLILYRSAGQPHTDELIRAIEDKLAMPGK